jgi:hypothetical protein
MVWGWIVSLYLCRVNAPVRDGIPVRDGTSSRRLLSLQSFLKSMIKASQTGAVANWYPVLKASRTGALTLTVR